MQRRSSAMEREIQQIRCRQRFYPRAKQSVRAARHFVREALADWAVLERADDILLCVSELATNAVRHGVPPGRGFLLCVSLDADGLLRVEVHDSGDGEPRPREFDEEAQSGRGLMIVVALSDKWGVGERVPGKVVWCEFACYA
jgi:serine/threonine-protein kinase RsbW